MEAARQFRDLLNGEGDFAHVPWAGSGFFADVAQYVDAYGTSVTEYKNGELVTMDKVSRDSIYNKQKGAAILTGQWIAMQYTEVQLACYYRGSPQGTSGPDEDPHDPNSRIAGPALFFGDPAGTPKPTAHAFRIWSRIFHDFPLLLQGPVVSENDEGKQLWVLGAKNDAQYAVLIANLENSPQEYTLTIEGKTVDLNNFQSVQIYQVDDLNDGKVSQDWNGSPLVIPGYTVQFLVLTPKVVGITETQIARPQQFNVSASNIVHNGMLTFRATAPAKSSAEIVVFNLLGQRVFSTSSVFIKPGNQIYQLPLPALSYGMYFVTLKTQWGSKQWKIFYQK